MKKFIALLLALVMALSLVACGSAPADDGAADDGADAGIVTTDLPEYKVGVVLYDLSNQWALNIMGCLEYLGDQLNVNFEYAVGGTDPEMTITAVQNFGAAGCDGVLTLHPGAVMTTLVQICEENDMFIVSCNDPANASADYATFSQSPAFAGEVWEDDYQIAYDIAADMIAKGAQTFALAHQELIEIVEHPAGDHRVEGHQADVAEEGQIAVPVPFGAGLFQLLVHFYGAGLGGAAQGKLHDHDGQTQQQQAQDINQHEAAAAVLAGHPGKLPDVAAADGAAGAQQDESQTGGQSFSFVHTYIPRFRVYHF